MIFINREITKENDLIKIKINVDGSVYATTYNDVLWDALHINSLSAYITVRGELKFNGGISEDGQVHCGLSDIAFACYTGWITNTETFYEKIRLFRDYKNARGLTIDHLDNNLYNNTIYNLSLMDRVLNTCLKQHITARFVEPYGIACAFVNGRYRVVYKKLIKLDNMDVDAILSMPFICDKAELLVNLLRTLETSRIKIISPNESARTVYNKTILPSTMDLSKAIEIQRQIANIDESLFVDWNGEYIPNNEIEIKRGIYQRYD